jgi:hypothetical protein
MLSARRHYVSIVQKKHKTEPVIATHTRLIKELAKPRMARSARLAEQKLDSARVALHPSITMPGTVDKIIPPPRPSKPEKAQIAVDGAHSPHRNLRIENTLLDENGDDVKLKKGAHVEITVAAEPKT